METIALIIQSLGAPAAITFAVLWALQYRTLVRKRSELRDAKDLENLWEQEKLRADSLSIKLQEMRHLYIDEVDDDNLADVLDGGMREAPSSEDEVS